jgi:hypothetical protein
MRPLTTHLGFGTDDMLELRTEQNAYGEIVLSPGPLYDFFNDLGTVIYDNWDFTDDVDGIPDVTIHMRHDFAAATGGNNPVDGLQLYSDVSNLRFTAVDGILDYTGEEVEGADYRFIPGNDYYDTGKVYATSFLVYPSGRINWYNEPNPLNPQPEY